MSGTTRTNDRQRIYSFNGRLSFKTEKGVGERFLVEAFAPAGIDQWGDEYQDYLSSLGFKLTKGEPKSGANKLAKPQDVNVPGAECYQA